MTVSSEGDRAPRLRADEFQCPRCGVYAHQAWNPLYGATKTGLQPLPGDWLNSHCWACDQSTIWLDGEIVYPRVMLGPPPSDDMPTEVTQLYDEAREVSGVSKKSAAALLRLALQVLLDQQEPGNATINDKIGALVKRGLDPQVQQAMDVLRVVGNNAVHPGQIELDSDADLLPALFGLLNLIVEQVITRPKHVAGLFTALPAGVQAAIQKRDT